MPNGLVAIYCLHIVAGLFWIGSSFLTAMAKGKGAERQYRWQMLAGAITVLVGGYLWSRMHANGFGRMEVLLALGAICALAAAGLQGVLVGGSLRRLRAGVLDEAIARRRITKGERFAAALTALALLCMVGSYHVGG